MLIAALDEESTTRAVLLAQNDFATFLKADDRERAEILQALTGTERFEAISMAIFDRYSTKLKAKYAGFPLTPALALTIPFAPAHPGKDVCSTANLEYASSSAIIASIVVRIGSGR